ncbi:methylthioribulose-1-phosphate dehydratase-like, partial [Ruditapes philippinarum]|uniref:methylthioribulose-1-phosphate dehydratase-like n=1 Tax=Ruditapes philippinarum TaxID=129788 RepID=UPI00295C31DB
MFTFIRNCFAVIARYTCYMCPAYQFNQLYQFNCSPLLATRAKMNGLPEDHPRRLIPDLCKQFYHLGWVTGTGGGISIKDGDRIYIAPSGVQKERIHSEDLFVQTIEDKDLDGPPPAKKLKKSQCTPLFMNAYTMADAGAVIHTHSKHAVMATLLYPGTEFKITHQEMIKGIKKGTSSEYYQFDDELVVPI